MGKAQLQRAVDISAQLPKQPECSGTIRCVDHDSIHRLTGSDMDRHGAIDGTMTHGVMP